MINEIESSVGWVIHQYPVRDNLLLLYILTPKRYFKGFYRVPKTKHGRQNPLSFCPYWISWKLNHQAINIQHLECCGAPLWFKNLKLFTSLYMNELIFNLCRPDELESCMVLYELYEKILRDPEGCPIVLLRQFEWQLLADCGYAIDFERTHDGQALEDDRQYHFSPDIGFFPLNNAYWGRDIKKVVTEHWDESVLSILKHTLRTTIDNLMEGKVLQSRKLLKKWLKNS